MTDYFTQKVDKIQVALLIEKQKQAIPMDQKEVYEWIWKGAWLEVLKQSQDKETILLAEEFENLPYRVQEVIEITLKSEFMG